VEPLAPDELTEGEAALRDRLLAGQVGGRRAAPAAPGGDEHPGGRAGLGEASGPDRGRPWLEARAALEARPAARVLVVDDRLALTSAWWPGARYLLADAAVTGLAPRAVPALGLAFDLGAGPPAGVAAARAAGVCCTRWIVVPETRP
jgi:hypothetical protein